MGRMTNQQCQSTGPKDQALIPPGSPHHVTILQHAIYSDTQLHTNTKMNLIVVKWAQWDRTQSRELLGLFIGLCVCIALCTNVAHNTAQNRPDNFPSYPPDSHHCSDDVYLGEGGYNLRDARSVVKFIPPENEILGTPLETRRCWIASHVRSQSRSICGIGWDHGRLSPR